MASKYLFQLNLTAIRLCAVVRLNHSHVYLYFDLCFFSPLDEKTLVYSKLKAYAEDKLKVAEMGGGGGFHF